MSELVPQTQHQHATLLGEFSMCCCAADRRRQCLHLEDSQPATGELAIVPPMLGSSSRLLNRDHHGAYFQVGLCTARPRRALLDQVLRRMQVTRCANTSPCHKSSHLVQSQRPYRLKQGMPRLNGSNTVLRRHGDEVQRLPGGYYAALGRVDDTFNLGGIKARALVDTASDVSGTSALHSKMHCASPPPTVWWMQTFVRQFEDLHQKQTS